MARWKLRLFEFDSDVVRRAGIKHQAAVALSCLETIEADPALIEDDLPVAVHETALENNANIQPVPRMNTPSDKTDVRVVTQVVESYDAKKKRATPTLLNVLHHTATSTVCKQRPETVGQANVAYTVDKNGSIV